MRRNRWVRMFKNLGKLFDNICYWRMVYTNMDKRERNVVIATGKYREFCNNNYIETKVKE